MGEELSGMMGEGQTLMIGALSRVYPIPQFRFPFPAGPFPLSRFPFPAVA
jgi:hypothetical protein